MWTRLFGSILGGVIGALPVFAFDKYSDLKKAVDDLLVNETLRKNKLEGRLDNLDEQSSIWNENLKNMDQELKLLQGRQYQKSVTVAMTNPDQFARA